MVWELFQTYMNLLSKSDGAFEIHMKFWTNQKAVWNFSENIAVFEYAGLPYK